MIEKLIWWLRSQPIYRFIFSGIKKKYLSNAFSKHSKEALFRCDKALKNAGVNYWLDFGTLLGAIREGYFIKHDDDIDIGVFLKDYSPEIENAMKKLGLKKIKQIAINCGKDGLEQSYSFKGVNIDIFYYLADNKKMWTYGFGSLPNESLHSTMKKRGGLIPVRVEHSIPSFIPFSFLGLNIFVPENYDLYLKEYYNNWKIPTLDWIPTRDSQGVKIMHDLYGSFTTYQLPLLGIKRTFSH